MIWAEERCFYPFQPQPVYLCDCVNVPYWLPLYTPQNKLFSNEVKHMIIHSDLSKMKSIILPTCLEGNYRDNLGEFNKT